jgi:hypothetical protein
VTHLRRSTLVWIALALAGLVVAVSVSYAASRLSKPQIGLTSEPVRGVTELAPKPSRPTRTSARPRPQPPPPSTQTTPQPPPTAPVVPPDDDGGGDDD